jgi:NAD-dependent dihydropyrimidine dehydrogenase PreA subunit
MAVRNIVQIDEELCDGCGECVPSCIEGALKIVDGKARLVSDALCDGLGACLGECPTGALTVIARDTAEFDEAAAGIHAAPGRTAPAHAPRFIAAAAAAGGAHAAHGGCPGSRAQAFDDPHPAAAAAPRSDPGASKLRQWPVQLHLVPPSAPFFHDRDVLLAADCVPVAVGDFHTSFLDGRGLAIACPKLDQHLEIYVQKLAAMIDEGRVRSLTVAIMEVPCCGGLVRLAEQARATASRAVPLRIVTVGIRGQILADRVH